MLNEVKKCTLCSSSDNHWKVVLALNEEQDLVQCSNCRLIFNRRQRIDLLNIYSDEYFHACKKEAEGGYFNYSMLEKALNKNYGFAYDFILKQPAEMDRKFRILDVGCGYGFFLKQFGLDGRFILTGVELNKTACDEAKKNNIEVSNIVFEDFQDSEKFDFITLFEFIEHTLDPDAVFRKVYALAKPGGFILFTTPDIGSFCFKLLKRKWPAIHPGSHNFYFSPRTIKKLAENNGFTVVCIKKRQFLWRDGFQLRNRFVELFPWSKSIMNFFSFTDAKVIPFLSGGSLEIILKK